mgnify:CR=1 FL=1
MLTTLRAEFKKLLTVRSTYILMIVALVIAAFFATYVFGYRGNMQQASSPSFLTDIFQVTLGVFTTFGAIISILLMAHEYRYNTILYTLTWNKSRVKVLLAKAFTVLSLMTVGGLLVLAVSYAGVHLGLSLRSASMGPQNFELFDMAWRYAAYVWGYGLIGLIFGVLLRSVVAAIVAFFMIPALEGILGGLLLKEDAKYLPFRVLDSIPTTGAADSLAATSGFSMLSSEKAVTTAALYLLILGVVATVLFIKRDASE